MPVVSDATQTAGMLRVVSAHNEVLEPGDLFTRHVEAAQHSPVPEVVHHAERARTWRFGEALFQQYTRRTCPTPSQYLGDLRADGVDAGVLFPGASTNLFGLADRGLVRACVRAYNDWLLDEFCSVDAGRLLGVCLVPCCDEPKAMLDEAARVLAKGAKAIYLPLNQARAPYDPVFDQLFDLLTARGVPIVTSALFELNSALPDVPGAPRSNLAIARMAACGVRTIEALTFIVLCGIFERFPGLKWVTAGLNLGWVPHWRQQLANAICIPPTRDRAWAQRLPAQLAQYIGRNLFFTMVSDSLGFSLASNDRQLARAGMYATAYPTQLTRWPGTFQQLEAACAPLDVETRHALLAGNALRVFGRVETVMH